MTVPPGPRGHQAPLVESALVWHHSGCSVIPIRADGTKRPAIEWKTNQTQRATSSQVERWFYAPNEGYNRNLGVGVVCGSVSGNLEMTELEGRAFTDESIQAIGQRCDELGVGDVFALLLSDDFGYSEITPSGGIHLLYRITDHEVPGNTKIARRPATPDELAAKPEDKIKVLAETRGEGGYVVVAPTGGLVHSTGAAWEVLSGRIGQIPQISWDNRNLIHQAIHDVLDQMPQEVVRERVASSPRLASPGTATRPGDDFNARADWADILEPHGWQVHHVAGGTTYWTRPGKSRRDGHSATTGHAGPGSSDRLYVMSSATEFDTDTPLSKFYVYAHYEHRGDLGAATRELASRGYGTPMIPTQRTADTWWNSMDASDWTTRESNVDSPANEASPNEPPMALLPKARNAIDLTLSGATSRFVRKWGHLFRYVTEEKSWRVWNGQLWESDPAGSQVLQAFEAMTEDMLDEAVHLEKQAETDETKVSLAKAMRKHVQQCRNASRSTIATMIATKVPVSASEFDADPRYLNLRNGVYDVVADEFLPHHPKYLLTKVAGVDYDPDAKAPRTEAFFAELLPSEPMREFTLQSLAYSLTGEADRKALFILQGVSNSGKTQITELGSNLFGDYAVAVSPGTFTKKREHGPNPELHNMRGARFVYTSETSYDIQLDEELVKRFTGKDTMSTRTLYERPQQWIPQCALWIATNNLPRFGSDSEAMWRRVKTIRFVNEFTDDASSGHQAVPNIGRTLAREEGSGLLNLLLDALRRYRNAGKLAEPQELKDSVAEHRQETDPVLQWLSVVREKGHLVEKVGARASLSHLRKAYAAWCQDEGYAAMAAQRFGIALMQALKYEKKRSNGDTWMVNWEFMAPAWSTWMRGD